MLDLARGLSPEQVRSGYVQVYREMLAAGYTVVGEFHYLGLPEAHAAVEAAAEAGIEIVLLLAAYGRGGLERFRQESPAEYLEQLEAIWERGIGICIGSDSNVRIDPLEELRELEGTARRRTGRRNVLSVSTLLCCGADEGAASLGLERWPDVEVDLEHPSLAGVEPADVHAALVFGCVADV